MWLAIDWLHYSAKLSLDVYVCVGTFYFDCTKTMFGLCWGLRKGGMGGGEKGGSTMSHTWTAEYRPLYTASGTETHAYLHLYTIYYVSRSTADAGCTLPIELLLHGSTPYYCVLSRTFHLRANLRLCWTGRVRIYGWRPTGGQLKYSPAIPTTSLTIVQGWVWFLTSKFKLTFSNWNGGFVLQG